MSARWDTAERDMYSRHRYQQVRRNAAQVTYDEGWRAQAACRGADTRLFYPDTTASGSVAASNRAKAMFCATCPVQKECAAEAFANDERGVWGCLSESERKKMQQAAARNRMAGIRAQLEEM